MNAPRSDAEIVRARYAVLREAGPIKSVALWARLEARGLLGDWHGSQNCSSWLYGLLVTGYVRRLSYGVYQATLTMAEFDATRAHRAVRSAEGATAGRIARAQARAATRRAAATPTLAERKPWARGAHPKPAAGWLRGLA